MSRVVCAGARAAGYTQNRASRSVRCLCEVAMGWTLVRLCVWKLCNLVGPSCQIWPSPRAPLSNWACQTWPSKLEGARALTPPVLESIALLRIASRTFSHADGLHVEEEAGSGVQEPAPFPQLMILRPIFVARARKAELCPRCRGHGSELTSRER